MPLERKNAGQVTVYNTTPHIISLYGRLPKASDNVMDNPTFRRRFPSGQHMAVRRSVFNLLTKSTTAKLLIEQGDLVVDGKYPEGWTHDRPPREFVRFSDINASEVISDDMIDGMLKPKRTQSNTKTSTPRKRGGRAKAEGKTDETKVAS